jgi:hypothetical protein
LTVKTVISIILSTEELSATILFAKGLGTTAKIADNCEALGPFLCPLTVSSKHRAEAGLDPKQSIHRGQGSLRPK